MNPQEIQKQNFESIKIPERKEGKNEKSDIPKSSTLSKYPNFDIFTKTLNTLDSETKNKLLTILQGIPDDELSMYIEMEADNSNLITEDDIKRFIKEKGTQDINNYNENKKQYDNINNVVKDTPVNPKDNTLNENIANSSSINNAKKISVNDADVTVNLEKEKIKSNISDQVKKAQETINKNIDTYRKIFADNREFLKLLDDSVINYESALKNSLDTKHQETIRAITDFLSQPQNRKAIFDKIAATGDAKLYQETYQALSDLSPTIAGYLKDVSPVIYEKPIPLKDPDDKSLISQFPGAKPEDIEKRGDLVSYNGKTIDLKTGKAYISGKGGYAIETSMKVPNSLDLRVSYQKERLEILETIKNKENTLEQIKEYKNTLTFEKNLHAEYEKISLNQDIDSNLRKTEIESQLKLIKKYKELAEERFPKLKEDPEVFADEMKKEIEEEKGKLKVLKDKFDADMQKLLEAGQDEIKARDEKVRETMSFLDDLGISNIKQNDLQKIINRINIHPQNYGFSKPIDLKKGFEGEVNNVHKQKHELLKLFSKIYQKMGIDISGTDFITDYKKIKAERRNQKEKFDINFKELLFTGGTFQIETFFTLIKEEPKEQTQKQAN